MMRSNTWEEYLAGGISPPHPTVMIAV